jgi:hypothetical protein
VLLDFDGVMFDVETTMGPGARVRAVHDLLARRPYWPRPLVFGAFGIHHMLNYIAEHKPDQAAEAEALIAKLISTVLALQGLRRIPPPPRRPRHATAPLP